MAKHEQMESYGIAGDDFEGPNVCRGCPKRFGNGPCTVYNDAGTAFRRAAGHCPVVRRYASWHKDKPIVVTGKKRIGQQKQRR